MREIPWLAEEPSASQEGLCSKELCIYLFIYLFIYLYVCFTRLFNSAIPVLRLYSVDGRWIKQNSISTMTLLGINRSTPRRNCPSALHLTRCHSRPWTPLLLTPFVKWPSLRQLYLFTHCNTSHSMYSFTPIQYTQPNLMPPYLPELRLSGQHSHLNGHATTLRRTYALAFSAGLYVVPSGENGIFVIL